MIHLYEGETANEVWAKAIAQFRQDQHAIIQSSRGGNTNEILHAAFSIKDPRQRWVVCRKPAINPAFAIAEIVWIVNGLNESSFLNQWNSQLPKYAGHGTTYHGAYGYRLRQQYAFDQLERAYLALRSNPDSRQVVLQIWDPRSDFPNSSGEPTNPDIPCNIVALLKVREQTLEWLQIMRSNDLFKGTPYNFVQFTSLQEIIAGWLDLKLGSYNHVSDSLHIYMDDIDEGFSTSNTDFLPNPDSLCLNKEESAKVFGLLLHHIRSLSEQSCTQNEISKIAQQNKLPHAYKNLLLVMCAESARRKRLLHLAHSIMDDCGNPCLKLVWYKWLERFALEPGK